MLCNYVRGLAPRFACCGERGSAKINVSLAVASLPQVSQLHSAVVSAERKPSLVGRWRSTPSSDEEHGQRRWSSTDVAPAVKGLTLNVDEKVQRVKHRIPQKRASFLLNELREEQRNGERCALPDLKIGDAIEVTMFANKKAARTTQARGVLVRKVNRGVDSTILLRDVINANSVEHHIPLFSPLIQSVEVMERAFIYQGKLKGKRVRPARIYYIRNLDQKFYRITGGGGSDN